VLLRVWHWLLSRATYRPRRISVVAWSLVWLFGNGIDRFLVRYSGPIVRADEWVLIAAVPVGIALVGWVWWSGRDARRIRRERLSGG
jgi:hypothetical protein